MGQLLAAAGYRVTAKPPKASTENMSAKARSSAMEVYERLGGRPEGRALISGDWDLAVEGNLLIELDEQEHFNRHRDLTLEGTGLPWTHDYQRYSAAHEDRCRTDNGFWTTNRSAVMFGPASAPGNHDGVGSPRWRQRALYDANKDIWVQDNPAWRLVRLSMYDVVDGVRLDKVLKGKHQLDPALLRDLVESRAAG